MPLAGALREGCDVRSEKSADPERAIHRFSRQPCPDRMSKSPFSRLRNSGGPEPIGTGLLR